MPRRRIPPLVPAPRTWQDWRALALRSLRRPAVRDVPGQRGLITQPQPKGGAA